ncbi:peptidoglycan editing factor PgeF [Shimazuella sp. AN120528]|uniref:peptidoglycan editing factor PgeF n=1 Tax=Shimazuella soli TaxID=1892854 RepID=UPI001F105F2C|nr:peptidoglycan editing factor PgeF [Shimazuella soli]MCH5584724.1 peptidoglycan editing factor PgeF [Shimazuella soli]
MEPFVLYSKNHPYLHLAQWESTFPHLVVGMSTRTEENRNYALHVGNDPEQVITNRQGLAKSLSFPFESWTCGEQVHQDHIELVTSADRGKGRETRDSAFACTDGLITDESDILLASFYADCVPLFFYSPDLDMIGVAHAGWKGTAANIGVSMIKKFLKLGADKKQILAAIGPSIGNCCYEVDDRVMEPLYQLLPKAFEESIFIPTTQGHYRLDLKKANQHLLLSIGLAHEQILVSNRCTQCEETLFFSHRREAANAGRMVAFIGKKRSKE